MPRLPQWGMLCRVFQWGLVGFSPAKGEYPSEDNSTSSLGPGTIPRTEGSEDLVPDSILEKLPYCTSEEV